MRMNKRELLWRFGLPAAVMLGGLLLGLGAGILSEQIELRKAEPETVTAEEPADGVGRIPAVIRYKAGAAGEEIPSLPVYNEYVEGEGPAPEWWRPEEPMAVEWQADFTQLFVEAADMADDQVDGVDYNAQDVIDVGCTDDTLYGWGGHTAEPWELDLFARIFYKEFWQPNMTLCEAGCDAILRLWESGEKGRTLGEVLSSTAENGAWTYSTYPEVWATDYDPDGLAWCRAFCEARFYAGPVWIAPYFRLDYYHDWAVPAYQIGNVYFSVEVQR